MSNRIDDYIEHGFHRIDEDVIVLHPPKIKWESGWNDRTDAEKIQYLEKLANTMNHAASLLQEERDRFGELCEKKEEQIKALKESLDQNNKMIQGQITKMNADKQGFHEIIQRLDAELRTARGDYH